MRLEGKTAIITGAASGMGAEEARLFAREGCKVVVADVSDELGESVVEEIGRSGGDAFYMHTDVTSMESWDSAVSETLGRFGAIDTSPYRRERKAKPISTMITPIAIARLWLSLPIISVLECADRGVSPVTSNVTPGLSVRNLSSRDSSVFRIGMS